MALLCAGCGGRAPVARTAAPACTAPADPFPTPTGWSWMSGADQAGRSGVYGTEGVASAANSPGARAYPAHWQDSDGNFWLFGGTGVATGTAIGQLDDLWEYGGGEWTWVGGTDQLNEPGVYGTRGVPSPGNLPGGRLAAAAWAGPGGGVWIFGGTGIDADGSRGYLDDLWNYNNGEWTWVGGPSVLGVFAGVDRGNAGVYGTEGVAAPGNWPGSRFDAVSWVDASGDLWLFGGEGLDSAGTFGPLNDLWEYTPATGMWAWMSGANVVNAAGVFGTRGVFAAGDVPGARSGAAGWTDGTNLWLLGGYGSDATGNQGSLDDLWEYSGGEWAWVGGSDAYDDPGFYGVQGLPGPRNYPGSRNGALTWTDPQGAFWLFGGEGFSCQRGSVVFGDLDDVWRYSTGQWAWEGGPSYPNSPGAYGATGSAGSGSFPGGRLWAAGWFGPSGSLWLFGGFDLNAAPPGATGNLLNDLWRFQPPPEARPAGAGAPSLRPTAGITGLAVPAGRTGAVTLRPPGGWGGVKPFYFGANGGTCGPTD